MVDPEYQGRSNRCLTLFRERKCRRAFNDLFASLISLVSHQSLELFLILMYSFQGFVFIISSFQGLIFNSFLSIIIYLISVQDKHILSDEVASATNYISFLESRIAELKAKRNQMAMSMNNFKSDCVVMRKVGVS